MTSESSCDGSSDLGGPTSTSETESSCGPPSPAKRPKVAMSSGSSSEQSKQFTEPLFSHRSLPATSGVMDFVEWVVKCVLADADRKALMTKFEGPVVVGSMCSGMGTEDIAMHAISAALLCCGQSSFKFVDSFKAESDKRKADFLRRRLPPSVQIYPDNASVGEDKPRCDVLTCGIVCVDVSSLGTTPKPITDQQGKSGKSLSGLLESLSKYDTVSRPKVIILECTPRLGHRRRVDAGDVPGTEYICGQLNKLGYVGKWRDVSSDMFYLPQSRPRVYGLFLKTSGRGDAEARLQTAMHIIAKARIQTPEALSVLLDRCSVHASKCKAFSGRGQAFDDAERSGKKWPQQHNAFRAVCKLPEDFHSPPASFEQQALKLMVPRAADAMWLKVARACVTNGFRWESECCIVPVSMSIRFGSIHFDKFPCLTPGAKYIIIKSGRLYRASAFTHLALQGLQSRELSKLRLASESERLLTDLAGNAFTANVIAIFLLAGLAVS